MTPNDLLVQFPQMMASLIWDFSESAWVPLHEDAPIIFGLSIGAAPIPEPLPVDLWSVGDHRLSFFQNLRRIQEGFQS
jgi:hypothetical protein